MGITGPPEGGHYEEPPAPTPEGHWAGTARDHGPA